MSSTVARYFLYVVGPHILQLQIKACFSPLQRTARFASGNGPFCDSFNSLTPRKRGSGKCQAPSRWSGIRHLLFCGASARPRDRRLRSSGRVRLTPDLRDSSRPHRKGLPLDLALKLARQMSARWRQAHDFRLADPALPHKASLRLSTILATGMGVWDGCLRVLGDQGPGTMWYASAGSKPLRTVISSAAKAACARRGRFFRNRAQVSGSCASAAKVSRSIVRMSRLAGC
jgi:hypothetical protein